MLQKEITIINKLGLHARAAAKFVTLASQFNCDIQVIKNNNEINGKSIMGIMMLAASKGSSVTLKIEGNDEKKALSELEALIKDRFGEDQ
ncbi:MAG: HPr family phosphocarrier protein [Gammaproteobacteria bacterium]|nr:HPr family phosphocarrier protein [Gammaproteobacteria bacterium]